MALVQTWTLETGGVTAAAKRISFNGRFTAARKTGVQRVAGSLVNAFDQHLDRLQISDLSAEILLPRGVEHGLKLRRIELREVGWLDGPAWEQLELPIRSRGDNLVNLCNAAPLFGDSAATMIHDAQVFISPASYSPKFVQWYRFLLPRIAQRSRQVLTVSNFSRQMLAEFGVSPEERTKVVYNGADHVFDTPAAIGFVEGLGLAAGTYVVVFGNYQAHKNLRVVLDAFHSPALKEVKLVVVGDVDRRLVETTLAATWPSSAVLAGRTTDAELRALLEGAICLVFPSKTEGFGLPPLEAMTLGCPAVVAPTGALPEVCADAVLYADPEDPQAWVHAISKLTFDSALRTEYSAQGRLQAGRFTWRRSAEHLHGVLEAVAV